MRSFNKAIYMNNKLIYKRRVQAVPQIPIAEPAVAIPVGIFIKFQKPLASASMEQNIYLPHLLCQKQRSILLKIYIQIVPHTLPMKERLLYIYIPPASSILAILAFLFVIFENLPFQHTPLPMNLLLDFPCIVHIQLVILDCSTGTLNLPCHLLDPCALIKKGFHKL
jgi:hypothetical protein